MSLAKKRNTCGVGPQRSIAKETGLDERYISRIIPLAFLTPDLTEAILEGKQAPHLSLDAWLGNTPIEWDHQRKQIALHPQTVWLQPKTAEDSI